VLRLRVFRFFVQLISRFPTVERPASELKTKNGRNRRRDFLDRDGKGCAR
jgi:hypothetical protein